ncbi:zinc-dependent alcohol dehydrogenase family protein [Bradyrhizobium sp. SRS-191]|uniref:zinc-dependent alcohol dehydrogenase family protein n=1 Tax=Bradyrhizobium sp. SRS-191 TaxID=2962606 RepID=UPI00211DF12E|nr:zinc-dependent alcohol dehydrogenase family protein [Bradyrhizobium sp. SRS-191]
MSAAIVLPNSLRGRMARSGMVLPMNRWLKMPRQGPSCNNFRNRYHFRKCESEEGEELMRAVLVRQPGGPDALELVELPVPTPGAGQVQIRAEAFGVGQPDVLIRRGVYKWMPPLPANPGNDVAGIISAVGAGVEDLRVGQKVLLSARDLSQRGGCYADYVVAPADAIHVLPDNVDLQAAVCLSNYQVAYALLQECRHPRAPASVLVIGAAGGVGTALVQLAKLAQMTVIGTVSTKEKAEFARSNGADHVIFYRRQDVVARTRELTGGAGVGLVLDHVCGPEFTSYLKVLGKWGTLLSYNAFAGLPEENLMAAMRNHLDICPAVRCFSFHIYDHDREGRRALMRNVIEALSRNAIKPAISAVLKLDDVRQAHTLLEQGSALGKIIMTR